VNQKNKRQSEDNSLVILSEDCSSREKREEQSQSKDPAFVCSTHWRFQIYSSHRCFFPEIGLTKKIHSLL